MRSTNFFKKLLSKKVERKYGLKFIHVLTELKNRVGAISK